MSLARLLHVQPTYLIPRIARFLLGQVLVQRCSVHSSWSVIARPYCNTVSKEVRLLSNMPCQVPCSSLVCDWLSSGAYAKLLEGIESKVWCTTPRCDFDWPLINCTHDRHPSSSCIPRKAGLVSSLVTERLWNQGGAAT